MKKLRLYGLVLLVLLFIAGALSFDSKDNIEQITFCNADKDDTKITLSIPLASKANSLGILMDDKIQDTGSVLLFDNSQNEYILVKRKGPPTVYDKDIFIFKSCSCFTRNLIPDTILLY